MGIGSDLQQAREAAKISLDAISQKTKISVHYLEAIESEDWNAFPSHAFTRGFIRAYAKLVKMDPVVATARFNDHVSPQSIAIEPMHSPEIPETNWPILRRKKKDALSSLAPPSQELSLEFDEGSDGDEQRAVARTLFTRRRPPSPKPWGVMTVKIGGAVLVALLLFFGIRALFKRPPHPPPAEQTVAEAVEAPTVAAAKPSARKPPPPPPAPTRPPVEAARPPAAVPTRAPAVPPTRPPAAAQASGVSAPPASAVPVGAAIGTTASAPMEDGYHHLVLKGLEASWVRVVMDGQASWSITLEPGMVKEYRAAQGFKVKIGNAAGVEATLNGRPLGPLGPRSKVVDLLLPAGYRPAKPQ